MGVGSVACLLSLAAGAGVLAQRRHASFGGPLPYSVVAIRLRSGMCTCLLALVLVRFELWHTGAQGTCRLWGF